MNDPISTPQVPPIPLVPAEMLHALTVAHAEIASLRLTDAEREAIEWYANFPDGIHADTLRGLLERLGGGR